VYCGRAGTGTAIAVEVGSEVEVVGNIGVGVKVSVKGGITLVDTGVGVEQEADKIISNAQNARCRIGYRLMNHIVSDKILINRENNLLNKKPSRLRAGGFMF